MSKRKNTIEKRLEHATYTKAGALSLFHRAADELDSAAAVAESVADEADDRRRHFETVTQAAQSEAEAARSSAAQIRSLVGA